MTAKRVQVTWFRWDARRMADVVSHPFVWEVKDEEGYARYFDSKFEAEEWMRARLEERV